MQQMGGLGGGGEGKPNLDVSTRTLLFCARGKGAGDIKCLCGCPKSAVLVLSKPSYDVALFHWLVLNQDC